MLKEFSRQMIRVFEELGVPRSTVDHLLQADKEILLAVRSVLDSGVQLIDELMAREPEKGIEKVEVQ
jgi:hypothetical protein